MVSVIIPTFNGLELLKICLPSLRKQTFKNFYNKKINEGCCKIVDAIRNSSVVTAACSMISKNKFASAGGFPYELS